MVHCTTLRYHGRFLMDGLPSATTESMILFKLPSSGSCRAKGCVALKAQSSMPKFLTFAILVAVLITCFCSALTLVQMREIRDLLVVQTRPTPSVPSGTRSDTTSIAGVWIPDATTAKRFPNFLVPVDAELFIASDGWILLRPSNPSGRRPEHECFRWSSQKDGTFKVSIATEQIAKLKPDFLEGVSEFEITIRPHDKKTMMILVSPVHEATRPYLNWLHEEAAGIYVLNRKDSDK